jgi:hypothetical protein
MQCPSCGYDGIAEEVVFCPHCRYQFRVTDDDIIFENPPDHPARITYDTLHPDRKFSEADIRLAKLQLLQPAILLMIATAGALYLSTPRIAQMSIVVSGTDVFYGSILCLILGAATAGIFYLVLAWRIRKS